MQKIKYNQINNKELEEEVTITRKIDKDFIIRELVAINNTILELEKRKTNFENILKQFK